MSRKRVLVLSPPTALQPPVARPRHAPHYALLAAAALREAGAQVHYIDCQRHPRPTERLVAEVQLLDPGLILVFQSDYNRAVHPRVLEGFCAALRDEAPQRPLWLGGRLSEERARQAATEVPSAEGVLFGEPEGAAELVRCIGAESKTELPSSIRRGEDKALVATPNSRPPHSSAPLPAWDLIDIRDYPFSPHQQQRGPVYPVLTSRGCPFPCFYCEGRARPAYTTRTVEAVLDEVWSLHRRFGAREIFFADPTFAVDRRWAMEFCRRLQDEGPPDLLWSCMARTDRVDSELLETMAAAGCWNLLFGIESTHKEVLERAQKALDSTTIAPAIRAAQAAGIEVIASIMIGLPGDSPQGFLDSLEELIRIGPDFAQFFVLRGGGGGAMDGLVPRSDWDTDDRFAFPGRALAPEAFSSLEELEGLRALAYRRFYLRPKYLRMRMRRVLDPKTSRLELSRASRGGLLALRMAAGTLGVRT